MKQYIARDHAKERALLRFGIKPDFAESWFNQLMINARLVGSDGKRDVYDHKGKRIIVEGEEIITITKPVDLPFGSKISKLVERELKKAHRHLKKKEHELSIIIAELTVEQSKLILEELMVNKKTLKAKIQTKLKDINDKLVEVKLQLRRERDEFKHLKMNSSGYLIESDSTAN